MMNRVKVGKWEFRYVVGNHSVGIISPTRKKHHITLTELHGAPNVRNGINNGMSDDRATPEQVAAYIVKNRLT